MRILKPRVHPDFPDYLVYPDGKIQSIKKVYFSNYRNKLISNRYYNKFLALRIHPKYNLKMVNLIDKNGNKRTVYIHRILAQLFVKNPFNKELVWFKDNNKNNITIKNLFWCDQGELNYIQQNLGKRNMTKQAAVMRKLKTKNLKNGRKAGGKIIDGRYIINSTIIDNVQYIHFKPNKSLMSQLSSLTKKNAKKWYKEYLRFTKGASKEIKDLIKLLPTEQYNLLKKEFVL